MEWDHAEVLCDWRKWPESPYRTTPMFRLGEDDSGIWLFAPRGAAGTYAEHGAAPLPVSFLTLVPHGLKWWIATWMRDNDDIDIDLYADIVYPPRWTVPDRLLIVDLDLDVIRRRRGDIVLDDEDEFALHREELHYPAEVVTAARVTAEEMLAAAGDSAPPVSAPPARWLAMGRAVADGERRVV